MPKLKKVGSGRAYVREDLRRNQQSIPYWRSGKTRYTLSSRDFAYRWRGQYFQIRKDGQWWNAHSIDFTFA